MIPIRRAARALIVSPEGEVLLMRLAMPRGPLWLTPGGGLRPGEDVLDGLARELAEEVGRSDLLPGPEVWVREAEYTVGGERRVQHERYFLIRTTRFEPDPRNMPAEAERDWFEGFRWWPIAAIAGSQERFAPRALGHLLEKLLRERLPAAPVAIGR